MQEKNTYSRDIGIIAFAVAAVALVIFMAIRFAMSDRPQPVGPIPQNVVGQSEKGRAMKSGGGKAGGEAAGGGSIGDSIQPPPR